MLNYYKLAKQFDHHQLFPIEHKLDLPGQKLMAYAKKMIPNFLNMCHLFESILRKSLTVCMPTTQYEKFCDLKMDISYNFVV